VHAEYEREDRYHDQIGRALRTTSHTLAVRAPARNPSAGHLRPAAVEYRVTHLYDNDADPYQRQNLARDPGFVRLQRQLARRLTDRIGAIEGVEVRMAPDVGPGTRVLISSFDELAQRAGVTPAAISQAESGRRGLSLDTVVRLCESLDVGLDDLLGIGGRPSPWLARHDRVVPTPSGTVPLFDDADAGARVHHVHLGEGQRGRPPQPHKGPEVVAVATGLVLVDLGESTPVLRAGDAVMASDVVVQGWTNLADGPSTLFWIAT